MSHYVLELRSVETKSFCETPSVLLGDLPGQHREQKSS